MFELKQNIISLSIIFFIIFYLLINYIKPGLIYTDIHTLRPFGLGYKNKTVIPLWLAAIYLAIISYVLSLYICNLKYIKF